MGRTDPAIDWLLGRVPLVGKLRRNLALSRFCATYEMQLQAGINVYDSLRAAADASQSARIEAFIAQRAAARARRGFVRLGAGGRRRAAIRVPAGDPAGRGNRRPG